jgi:phage terminase large subunit GpA-like protein
MMYSQKTNDAVKDFSTQKLKPNIDVCSKVRKTLGEDKPKHLSDSYDQKNFPGGFVSLGPANSDAFLRGKSIARAMLDEEDSYERNVGDDGSTVGNVRKRMVNFPNRKLFRLSTPKIKETSTIEEGFEAGSQEYYYLPCPHCNEHAETHVGATWFVLKWDLINYGEELEPDTGLPLRIWAECPACGCDIEEHHKGWMLEKGRWMSEKGSPGEPYEVGDVEFPSFHLSSLYSPLGFFSWRDAVREWFEYKRSGDRGKLQTFINQTLGETFSLQGADVSSSYLHQRREEYFPEGSGLHVPPGGLVLTFGADVQMDRIECEIVAWGLGEESWSIDYAVLYGDTSILGNHEGLDNMGNPTAWKLLDDYLGATRYRADGTPVLVECGLVDSGFATDNVHTFTRLREHRRIFPCHGKNGWGRGYFDRPKKRHEKYHTYSFPVYVDEIKNKIYSSLLIEAPGPGFCHFPKTDVYHEKYFTGLTAENKEVKVQNGVKKLVWVNPPGARNEPLDCEPLDCRVYAYAALRVYSPNIEARAQQLGTARSTVGMEAGAVRSASLQRRKGGTRARRGSPGL